MPLILSQLLNGVHGRLELEFCHYLGLGPHQELSYLALGFLHNPAAEDDIRLLMGMDEGLVLDDAQVVLDRMHVDVTF